MKRHHAIFFGVLGLSVLLGSQARATLFNYDADLNGFSESPPNASPGTGFADVLYDSTAHTLKVDVTFSGLLGTTTASHIHAATATPGTGTAGVATAVPRFPGFPVGVTSGTYDHTFDLTLASSYNPAYITASGGTTADAEAALAAALAADKAYLNIHTTVVPGGEIRGFLLPAPIPDSFATAPVLALAFLAVFGCVRYQRPRA